MDAYRYSARACAIVVLLTCVANSARAYTLKTVPGGARVRWHRSSIELVVHASAGAGASPAGLLNAVREAATTWSAVPGAPALSVTENVSGEPQRGLDGVNGVYVLARWPFPERSLAVTVSTYAESTGELIEADILINGELHLAVLETEGADAACYDLTLVLTHELGHLLGLGESDVAEATMWPLVQPGETGRRELAVDDVDAILALYGGAPRPKYDGGCAVVATRRSSARAILGVFLAACLVAISRRRRSHARS